MVDFDFAYPRRVIVDDTDSRITYSEPWTLDRAAFSDYGITGEPYNKTMTGTKSATASFTFTFEGDFVQVRGAKDNRKIPPSPPSSLNDSLGLFPNYTCQIDNHSIPPSPYNINKYWVTNVVLCERGQLSKARHTLTMNITINDLEKQIFWLDSIQYSPLDNADLTEQVLKVDSSDSKSCSFRDWSSGSWHALFGVNYTVTPSATMSLKFNGTSVSLYSQSPTKQDGSTYDGSTGSYYIDNGHSVPFNIPGSRPLPSSPENNTAWANQLLFTTDTLVGGKEHEMVITYSGFTNGSNDPHPLIIDYFYVTRDDGRVNGGSTGSGDGTRANDNKVPVGAIVGGIVGGMIALVILSGLVCFMIKRRKRQMDGQSESNDDKLVVTPFTNMTECWTSEPLPDSHAFGNGAEENVVGGSSLVSRQLQRAQQDGDSEQVTEEREGGTHSGQANLSPPTGAATRLPPVYTPE
ncbi:hypothetical protein AAF712_013060 [Marasmius tenuissimus]|uniref:Uncharacterized protein n=1 Tax=Marasmius tenuissimus TaxID=585030 RepID=A0ABR2ZGV4_9AGAR